MGADSSREVAELTALGEEVIIAAERKDLEKLKKLLGPLKEPKVTFVLNAKEQRSGRTALLISTIAGDLATVNYLLEKKANVRTADINCKSPIHYAIGSKNLPIARALLNYSARDCIESSDLEGKTAIHIALENDDLESFKLLLQYCSQDDLNRAFVDGQGTSNLLLRAVGDNRINFVTYMLDFAASKKFKLETEKNTGGRNYTSLHLLARQGNTALLRRLLEEFNANPNVTTRSGRTPLHEAIKCKNIECCLALLSCKRFYWDSRDSRGNTPMIMAAKRNLTEVCKVMLSQTDNPAEMLRFRNKKGTSAADFFSDAMDLDDGSLKSIFESYLTKAHHSTPNIQLQICSDLHIEFLNGELSERIPKDGRQNELTSYKLNLGWWNLKRRICVCLETSVFLKRKSNIDNF
eukprot:TRINITY_DN8227_c0_g1_i2.p1 TRINITY_DN8227_c0_g1~~TRINITY_DN8227_c0_g1_i2.p1  ORF type:complete len:416 (+),score=92.18 TRINITY_DN8227_c0_g1_i2:26-1249(+)